MKATTSASCSRPPDRRRSARIGRLSCRYSSWRLSWGNGPTGLGGDVARHAERQARLPHAGTGGENDEVGTLQAVQLAIDLLEPGRHADEVAVVSVPRLELVERVLERVADAYHRVGDATL